MVTPGTDFTLVVTCPRCAGPLTLDNHHIRRDVDDVGCEGIAVLSCAPCRRRWDLFLHLSASATRTPKESGAQQRARQRLAALNTH